MPADHNSGGLVSLSLSCSVIHNTFCVFGKLKMAGRCEGVATPREARAQFIAQRRSLFNYITDCQDPSLSLLSVT